MTWEHELFSKTPELYQQYDKDEILYPDLDLSYFHYHKLIVVGENTGVIFMSVGLPSYGLRISGRTIEKNHVNAKYPASMHTLMSELEQRLSEKTKQIHGFAIGENDMNYTYLGQIIDIQTRSFEYVLHVTYFFADLFPDRLVYALSGFTWEIIDPTNDEDVEYINTKDEARDLITKLIESNSEAWVTHIEGQCMLISVNRTRGIVKYGHLRNRGYSPPDVFARDPEIDIDSDETIQLPQGGLMSTEMLSWSVPRDDAIKAVLEFIETGKRPTCIQWRE